MFRHVQTCSDTIRHDQKLDQAYSDKIRHDLKSLTNFVKTMPAENCLEETEQTCKL
jgi:hypothetical protein